MASVLQCNQCAKSFSNEFNLNNHVEIVHEGKRFQCDECGEQLSSVFRVGEHISQIHNEVYIAKDAYTIVWVPVSSAEYLTEAEKDEKINRQKKEIVTLQQKLRKILKKNANLRKIILLRQAKSFKLRSRK